MLSEPEGDRSEHEGHILRDVCVSVILITRFILWYDVLEHQQRDATGQSTSHESETDEKEQTSSPNDIRFTTVRALRKQALFVDQVDDEQTKRCENSWNPIDEINMYGWNVGFWELDVATECAGVKEDAPGDSKECAAQICARRTTMLEEWKRRTRNKEYFTRIVFASWKTHCRTKW